MLRRVLLSVLFGCLATVAVAWGVGALTQTAAQRLPESHLPTSAEVDRWIKNAGPLPAGHALLAEDHSIGPIGNVRLLYLKNSSDDVARPQMVHIVTMGWPFRALYQETWRGLPSAPVVHRFRGPWVTASPGVGYTLPLAPLMPGFLLDVLVFASIPLITLTAAAKVRRTVRFRAGQCTSCGHQLNGAASCSECGSASPKTA